MILNPDDIEKSITAWASGERSPVFNGIAMGQQQNQQQSRVDMSPANDRKPGILGYNR